MGTEDKASPVESTSAHIHKHTVREVLGLTEALLDKVDLATLESFKFLLEGKIDRSDLDRKADKHHHHDLKELPGVRRGESLLQSFQGIVSALNGKAARSHTHGIRDIVSLHELKDFIRSLFYPTFTFSVHKEGTAAVYSAYLHSTNGYYMPGVTIEYRNRLSGQGNWDLVDVKHFEVGVFLYSVKLEGLNDHDLYDCEITVKDSLNPEYRATSPIVTIRPDQKQVDNPVENTNDK